MPLTFRLLTCWLHLYNLSLMQALDIVMIGHTQPIKHIYLHNILKTGVIQVSVTTIFTYKVISNINTSSDGEIVYTM